MIDDAEIRRRASAMGVQEGHVERDYVLTHLLAALSEEPGDLVFRGGTALARVYWPDFRLSEDLDFITPGSGDGVEQVQQRMADRARMTTGIELTMSVDRFRDDRSRAKIEWVTPWASRGYLQVDTVRREQPALPHETRSLAIPYSDLSGDHAVPVLQLADILGSKWAMLDERDEPRDLFDVWFGLTQAGTSFADLARGHRARYGYDPIPSFLDRARRLRKSWRDRLSYQVSGLPDFDVVIAEVRAVLDASIEST